MMINWMLYAIQAGQTIGNSDLLHKKGENALFTLLLVILIPVVIVFFFFIKILYTHTVGKQLKTTLREDYENEAEAYIRKNKFVSAGTVYETKLKDFSRAAECYEKGGDYKRAALMYDYLKMSQESKDMYQKAGDFDTAAAVSVMEGDYEAAAALFDSAGKKIDAAKMLELSGRRRAAVRLYREAGEYRKAAGLLEEEGKYKEAAEMFSYLLAKQKPVESNLRDFYAYALLCEKAGAREKAQDVFEVVFRINPDYEDVRGRLGEYAPEPVEEPLPEGFSTLRSFMKSGNLAPYYGLKFWVHIMKQLKEAYRAGWAYGIVSPDTIGIDAKNTIVFLDRTPAPDYRSPESKKGDTLDERSDIYSAGVLLYEMLAGDLHGLGTERLIDRIDDIPDWLDEMVITCIRKVREDRYQSIDNIFAELKTLSDNTKG
jgi:tetratricopeptide (TPR) repeat protein